MRADAGDQATGRRSGPLHRAKRRQLILVSSAEAALCASIGQTLENAGFYVLTLRSNVELAGCVRLVARDRLRPPPLIGMDLDASAIVALRVLEEVRAFGWSTSVLLFGEASSLVAQRIRKAGSTSLLAKPVNLDMVQRVAVEALIPRREAAPDAAHPA